MKSNSPYSRLSTNAFWKTAVTGQNPKFHQAIYSKKFEITQKTKIVTAGSCFAQHINRTLKNNNFSVIDVEPAPKLLPKNLHSQYGYSMYSARFGNIYTMRQLFQLAQEAFGTRKPADIVWEKNGSYYDSLRPSVEPEGMDSPEEVILHREHHIRRVRKMFLGADLFIFTLGLTEAWEHKESGTIFPTVPGSLAGEFKSDKYVFKNFQFQEVLDDFNAFKSLLHQHQVTPNKAKFLLTVSPVPLTASNSGQHVLNATTYSKSVLRSVAGQLFNNQPDVDYFPSFEIINNCWSKGIFYKSNMRSVTQEGVDVAMKIFLDEYIDINNPSILLNQDSGGSKNNQFEDIACEEALLEEFLK